MRPEAHINARQQGWARRRGIAFDDDGYVLAPNDNLFLPLSGDAARHYREGAGDELRRNMSALHSSSALVVNVFDYWLHLGDPDPILRLLKPGLGDVAVAGVQFEARLPIDWPSPPPRPTTPPHLDLVVRYEAGPGRARHEVLAVESKFREPYGQDQGSFADRYFDPANAAMWDGLGPLLELAGAMRREPVFRRLKASQLIKHVLGLRSRFPHQPSELLYLWYDMPGPEAVQHAQEVERFAAIIGGCGLGFRSLTYQDVLLGLSTRYGTDHRRYVDYLMERYF